MDIRPRSRSPPSRHKKLEASIGEHKKTEPSQKVAAPIISPRPEPSQKGPRKKLGNQAHHRSFNTSVVQGAATKIRQVECFVYDSSQPSKSENLPILHHEIGAWLQKPIPDSFDGKPPVAGLRLLVCKQPMSTVNPFDEHASRAINATLGLPESYSYLTTCNAGACGKYITAGGQPIFIYHRSNNNGTISAVLHWSSATNVTFGYLHLGPRISLHKVTTDLTSQFPSFSHPLFVPTYLGECTAADLMQELYHIHLQLARAEGRTRFGDWEVQDEDSEEMSSEDDEKVDDNKKASTAVASVSARLYVKSKDKTNGAAIPNVAATEPRSKSRYWAKMKATMDAGVADHHVLSQILGALSCRFAFMEVAIGCSIESAEFTLSEMEQMRVYCGSTTRLRQLKGVRNSECLKHRIELLSSNLKHIKVFGAIAQRMRAQQNVLFNLVAQEDNDLNRGIAEDSKQLAEASKRDSSAMKIIAFLTTLFLPGTFVATFFAMPLFDWGAYSMTNVMTDHFWIYWTVTVPLTLLVMGIVGMYAWNQARRNRVAADEARKKAGIKEA